MRQPEKGRRAKVAAVGGDGLAPRLPFRRESPGVALIITPDRQIGAQKPADRRYERRVSDVRGLSLRIYPSRLRQLEARYAIKGGPRRRAAFG